MKLYFGNGVTTATTLMILAMLGFIGWSAFNRTNIQYWGRRSAVLLVFGLVVCCFAAARDGLDKTIQHTIDGSCAPGLFPLVSVPTIVGCVGKPSITKCFFRSPIVDMENLICNMMQWSNVTEQELAEKREITTDFGETLSWEYLCYVRKHPIIWNVPTCILYGEHDNLTSIETVSAFAKRHHADLTVMPDGEHWFHTEEQMQFLDHWIRERSLKDVCG